MEGRPGREKEKAITPPSRRRRKAPWLVLLYWIIKSSRLERSSSPCGGHAPDVREDQGREGTMVDLQDSYRHRPWLLQLRSGGGQPRGRAHDGEGPSGRRPGLSKRSAAPSGPESRAQMSTASLRREVWLSCNAGFPHLEAEGLAPVETSWAHLLSIAGLSGPSTVVNDTHESPLFARHGVSMRCGGSNTHSVGEVLPTGQPYLRATGIEQISVCWLKTLLLIGSDVSQLDVPLWRCGFFSRCLMQDGRKCSRLVFCHAACS
ncbi:hypothetical protein GWK47_045643 [Chionoecetes opilio]|uniref:Uncharacterized protein n=1 Tax=Chionoecetes opilio TaxID=41210 RepID=A0A8J4YCR0_CHIOP|nr:hypothetical protein GWK47_045643 [Chionoecetes opilio]